MDHVARVHQVWRPTLVWMSKTEEPLTKNRLRNETMGPYNENAVDMALKVGADDYRLDAQDALQETSPARRRSMRNRKWVCSLAPIIQRWYRGPPRLSQVQQTARALNTS